MAGDLLVAGWPRLPLIWRDTRVHVADGLLSTIMAPKHVESPPVVESAPPSPEALAAENAELRAMLETATAPKPQPRRTISFRKPAKLTEAAIAEAKAAQKNITIANADIMGDDVMAGLPIAVKDFAISFTPRSEIIVYMPASGPRAFYKHVGPRMVAVPESITVLDANGERITHQPDASGKAAQSKLETAIRDAWANANATCRADGSVPYDRDWPLSL
mgnify:CR=1 FL=1